MIRHGDCLEVMAAMEPESVDAIVCDPPYGLEFMGKDWDRLSADPNIGKSRKTGFDRTDGPRDKRPGNEGGTWFGSRDAKAPNYNRTTNAKCRKCGKWRVSGGHGGTGSIYGCKCAEPDFPNVARDASLRMQAWHQQWAEAAYRVAKPSAYLLAFGGTRTVHRLASAIEDAGWIIRDTLVWAYASGFPKSKASLKPAWEPIVMARKPGPLRELAIDACRIPTEGHLRWAQPRDMGYHGGTDAGTVAAETNVAGRWPANVILSDPIFDGDTPGVVGGGQQRSGVLPDTDYGREDTTDWRFRSGQSFGDTGTYSRFFLIPKADRADREPVLGGLPEREARTLPSGYATERGEGWRPPLKRRNVHPTVKPTELMRHLVRLVTPPGGLVLDPFLGSGTTGLACEMEGFPWIGIEREAEYVAIAEARLNGTQRGLGLDVDAPTTPYTRKPPHVGPGTPWVEWINQQKPDSEGAA